MATLDLDAERTARAAQAETGPALHMLRVGGKDFTFPAELPYGLGKALLAIEVEGEPAVERALVLLFGEEQHDTLVDQRLTTTDLNFLFDKLPGLYGLDGRGESSTSNGSSPTTGNRSRPTSNRSTKSTSGKRAASARKRKG